MIRCARCGKPVDPKAAVTRPRPRVIETRGDRLQFIVTDHYHTRCAKREGIKK